MTPIGSNHPEPTYCSGKGTCSGEMYSPSTHNDEYMGGCPIESKHMYTSKFCDAGVAECGTRWNFLDLMAFA